MKKLIYLIAMLVTMGAAEVAAQDLDGYRRVDVQEEQAFDAFTFFTKAPILLSGDRSAHNAMTIGWGSFGNYLGYERTTVTVLLLQPATLMSLWSVILASR